MRLLQNSGIYPSYLPQLRKLDSHARTFAEKIDIFLNDRFGAAHILQPVLQSSPDAFFTNGDDPVLQRAWAIENHLPQEASLQDILLAQIESHRTEVFYNLDPMRYGSSFIRRLPGCVKKTIAWRAAPSPGADFAAYDLIVCNFPSILQGYREAGWRAAYFFPGHDPVMDSYAAQTERPIDVLFVGGYSRHHRQRAIILESVAALRHNLSVAFHLDRSRMTRLAETPLGWAGPLARHRRPAAIRAVSKEPVFGRQLYAALGQAKIVLNGAVDMAGSDRGNMRCWEAMGCGALLLSDAGIYPEGMVASEHFLTYENASNALDQIREKSGKKMYAEIALSGYEMIAARFSKEVQWVAFCQLAY
jgi:hypothetical protein